MYELKTNTAVRIPVGPLVDPTDGKTAETALTVTGMSVEIFQVKTDGTAVVRTAFSPTASGGNNDMVHVTDDTTGMYDLELTAAQLNFLGNARIAFYDVDGFLVHYIDVLVVSANYFDWKYGTGNVNADAVAISGDSTAADNLETACDGGSYNLGGGGVVAAKSIYLVDKGPTLVVSPLLERPESSEVDYLIEVLLGDAPDEAPTIDVSNQAGTSRNLNLDSTTMTQVGADTKRYRATYTVDTSHAIEQLSIVVSVTEGAVARNYGAITQVADDKSTKIDAIHEVLITSNAELSGTPAAAAGIAGDVKFLAMLARNESVTTKATGVQQVKNNSGSVISEATHTDIEATFTKGKFADPE